MARQRVIITQVTTSKTRTKKNKCTCGGTSNGTRKKRSDAGKKRGTYAKKS